MGYFAPCICIYIYIKDILIHIYIYTYLFYIQCPSSIRGSGLGDRKGKHPPAPPPAPMVGNRRVLDSLQDQSHTPGMHCAPMLEARTGAPPTFSGFPSHF